MATDASDDANGHDPQDPVGSADPVVDLSGLPEPVAAAIGLLIAHANPASLAGVPRGRLGDVIQAAERVKAFADAGQLDATAALVDDVAADHGVPADDPRFARKVAVHRKSACRAVVHEVQLLTGSTLTAARDRVRFATALTERTGRALHGLRVGGCTWERARIAYVETAHLDPVLAGRIIDRLLAPPDRTAAVDGGPATVPLSHSGFRARIRRQLALVHGAAADAKRRHRDAVQGRDACTYPGPDGTATFQACGGAARVFTAQQRIADLAKAAKAAGDERTLAQLRADIAIDLLVNGTIPGHQQLGDAPAGRLHVIVPLAAILPDGFFRPATGDPAQTAGRSARGAAFGLGEVPGLGFLSAEQVRQVALQAGSTWARLVTDPITGAVIDAANTYRAPAGMARLVKGRDHTCRAPGDCGISAADADLDHDVEYQPGATEPAEGATHADNLHAAHRGHHNVKTGRFWVSDQHEDASISWCTLTRQLRTAPYDHHRPGDHSPPSVSRAEQRVGILLATSLEPDLTPHVFTDLDDLHLIIDRDTKTDLDETAPRGEIIGDGPHRIHLHRFRPPIPFKLPDPPPPF